MRKSVDVKNTMYRGNSAFVTSGALLSIKSVGSDEEHGIALDADAMDDRTNDRAGLGRFGQAARRSSGSLVRDGLSGHGRNLARRGVGPIGSQRHPGVTKDESVRGKKARSAEGFKRA